MAWRVELACTIAICFFSFHISLSRYLTVLRKAVPSRAAKLLSDHRASCCPTFIRFSLFFGRGSVFPVLLLLALILLLLFLLLLLLLLVQRLLWLLRERTAPCQWETRNLGLVQIDNCCSFVGVWFEDPLVELLPVTVCSSHHGMGRRSMSLVLSVYIPPLWRSSLAFLLRSFKSKGATAVWWASNLNTGVWSPRPAPRDGAFSNATGSLQWPFAKVYRCIPPIGLSPENELEQ